MGKQHCRMENIDNPGIQKFQVTISFFMDEHFMGLVQEHREYINKLINSGVIEYYAVSLETHRSWIVFQAKTKQEVEGYLSKSSIYTYWTIEIDELFVFDSHAYRLPALQLN